MVLDHNFGWDDGLICGGSVSGLILPRAAEAAELWRKLAAVTEPIRWGVKKDFSIALVEGSGGVSPAVNEDGAHGDTPVPAIGFIRKLFRRRRNCGLPVPATSRRPSRRSRCSWISPSRFSMTGRNWRTTNFFRPKSTPGRRLA